MMAGHWLNVRRSDTPLILAMPHGGTLIPDDATYGFISPWLALRDADWHIAQVYADLVDATVVESRVSRSVIDVNRDPSGASLYPGQATTDLCPRTTFDGDPLFTDDGPADAEIARRRQAFFDPYHAALAGEIGRLRTLHHRVVVYDCHAIRSRIPRLFEGELPELNIGSNNGATCDPALRDAVMEIASQTGRSYVVDGRFRGGWTTRHYGTPASSVHAIQMELAFRAYLDEPKGRVSPANWPVAFDPAVAAPLRTSLKHILTACLEFAR